ncbi:MAG: pentapeptide repeat-containing protein [Chloroflexales bacterium]|nr:pentapeptide repeat-containing protein [Chloroflexales bacterium]
MRRNLVIALSIIAVLVLVTGLVQWLISVPAFPQWTGLGEHTAWDLADLLIVPLALALAATFFTARERDNDRHIARDRDEEGLLQTYFGSMTELILEKGLREHVEKDDAEVFILARARTVATLSRLADVQRRNTLLRFLRDAKLPLLRGALSENIKLSSTDLQKATLRKADLQGADLQGADLQGADLQWANLRRADLQGADLQGADLTWADLRGANVREADLVGADLRMAVLIGADLRGANVRGANLRGADLRGADLREPYLRQIYLRWAELTGVDLRGPYLRRAYLLGVRHDAHTRWPKGFPPPATDGFPPPASASMVNEVTTESTDDKQGKGGTLREGTEKPAR